MARKLIILRGNSGSGKTTVATTLQRELGRDTMLLSQDVIRRQILHVSEKKQHPTMKFIAEMAEFGWNNGYNTVIVEGILGRKKNGPALLQLMAKSDRAFVYYFDIPFTETLRRHATKPNAGEFGEAEMRDWWQEKDMLHITGEQIINETQTRDEIIAKIIQDTKSKV